MLGEKPPYRAIVARSHGLGDPGIRGNGDLRNRQGEPENEARDSPTTHAHRIPNGPASTVATAHGALRS